MTLLVNFIYLFSNLWSDDFLWSKQKYYWSTDVILPKFRILGRIVQYPAKPNIEPDIRYAAK